MGMTEGEKHSYESRHIPSLSKQCPQCRRITHYTKDEVDRCLRTQIRNLRGPHDDGGMLSNGHCIADLGTYIACAYGCRDGWQQPISVYYPII